jgi:PKD repeat protein
MDRQPAVGYMGGMFADAFAIGGKYVRFKSTAVVTAAAALVIAVAAAPTIGGAAAADTSVRITASGDFAATSNTAAVLSSVAATNPDLHLALGDLSYGATGSEQAWCDFVTARVGAGFPFELVAGNHESNGQNGNINDFSACLPNQLPGVIGTYGRQWYVDVPRDDPFVRLVMISPALPFPDGTWTYQAGSPRYAWTAAAIDGARAAGVPWVVVGMHKPCLSIGQYSCDPGSDLMNLLVAKRVDLVLSGHEHLYQRTKQLAHGPGCTSVTPDVYTAACVADSDQTLTQGRGTVFATVGTGGIALRDVNLADPEVSYHAAWSGLNANPTWGSLALTADDAQLSASFTRAAGGSFTDGFTITKSGVNQPPVSSIAVPSCTSLSCSFDGSASSDPDGTIASYAWDFGDGSTGSGVTPGHVYAAAGTYTVTLTVTDDDSATDVDSRSVTVTVPPVGDFAADTFTRTVSGGWGSADTGGAWSSTSGAANFAVAGGLGTIRMASAGSGPQIYLNSVSRIDAEVAVTASFDKPATGGGIDLSVVGRRVVGEGDYRGKVRVLSTGGVRVGLSRANAAGAQTVIQPETLVAGLTVAAGDQLRARVQVTGTGPTTLRIKVWKVGSAEPASWQLTGTDTTAGLQAAGSIGIHSYLSGSTTNAPITGSFDDLIGRAAAP